MAPEYIAAADTLPVTVALTPVVIGIVNAGDEGVEKSGVVVPVERHVLESVAPAAKLQDAVEPLVEYPPDDNKKLNAASPPTYFVSKRVRGVDMSISTPPTPTHDSQH